MNIHLLVHIDYLLPSSEKDAPFLVDEYHQSNMAVTFCAILQKDFIFHTNIKVRKNYETITGNIYEINSCM